MLLCALETWGHSSVLEQEAGCVMNGQWIHPLERLEPDRVNWVTLSPYDSMLRK